MTRKRALLITIIVLLAAAVITASIALSPKRTTTQASPSSLGTNAEGFEISPIKAGEGGSAMGPDGITPIGYPPTCDGAYAAAINYRQADQSIGTGWENTRETLRYIAADDQQVLDGIQTTDEMVKKYGLQDYAVPNIKLLGIFKPINCESGKIARVIVSDVTLTKFPDTASYVVIKASPLEVIWTNDDWKFSPVNDPRDGETLNLQLQTSSVPEISPQIIDALFTAEDGQTISREGWMVVSNATQ